MNKTMIKYNKLIKKNNFFITNHESVVCENIFNIFSLLCNCNDNDIENNY